MEKNRDKKILSSQPGGGRELSESWDENRDKDSIIGFKFTIYKGIIIQKKKLES